VKPSSPAGSRFLLWGAALLLAAALAIRLVGALLPQVLPDGDSLGYLEAARHVAEGEGLVSGWIRRLPSKDVRFPVPYRGYPALPLLAGGLGSLGIPLEAAGMGLVLLLVVLGFSAFLAFWKDFGRQERGEPLPPWTALLPLGLLAFHKHLTVATVEILTDGPALAAGIFCLFFLWKASRRKGEGAFLLSSALAGLAALAGGAFRYQDLFLLLLGPAWLLLSGDGKRRLTGPGAFLLPLLPALPWILAHKTNLDFLVSVFEGLPPPSPLQGLAAAFDPTSPHSLFAGLGPLVWFSLGGFLLLVVRPPHRKSGWTLLLLYLGAGLLPLLLVRPEKGWIHAWFFADRPALQLLPPLVSLAALPLVRPFRQGRGISAPRVWAAALAVLLLLSLRASWRYAWKRKRLTAPAEIEGVLEALKSGKARKKGLLLSPETRFFAWEGRLRGFQARDPYSLKEILDSLPGSGVRWVAAASRWDRGIPWAEELLELPRERIPSPLILEKEFRSGPYKARLFRLGSP